MKSHSYLLAGLMFVLSAGLLQAAEVVADQSPEKQKYISWTWDDIAD